jgi:hypothetical protein
VGQVFPRVFRFIPFSILPPILHIPLHVHVAVTRSNGRSMGTFHKAMPCRKSGGNGWRSASIYVIHFRAYDQYNKTDSPLIMT